MLIVDVPYITQLEGLLLSWPLQLCYNSYTVNQQILAAIKFDVSQNKVIWRLLNMASPSLCSVRLTSLTYVGSDKY